MSATIPDSLPEDSPVVDAPADEEASRDDFCELVDRYTSQESLPSAPWLTQLGLDQPRVNVRCLDARTRTAKRLLDVALASAGLLVLWPVMLLTALMVKLTSPGPAIFKQERIGLNQRRRHRGTTTTSSDDSDRDQSQDRRKETNYGKPFVLYKFRTMRNDAEKNGAQFATKGDPRVTSIGRFLRKTRLDELPQLWNVIRGDMSLVGPRPERPEFIKELSDEIPDYVQRLGLKPGVTGLAQVINGYDNNIDSFRRKVALDLHYMQNCCMWNDVKILFRTVGVVLTGKGAL